MAPHHTGGSDLDRRRQSIEPTTDRLVEELVPVEN
jgi:hypothetical protein